MSVVPIGVFAFGTSPIEHMGMERVRALLAEASLQGAELVFFSTTNCHLGSGEISATRWTWSGWESGPSDLPALVTIITNPITERHRQIDTWLRKNTRIVGFHNHDKLELAALIQVSPWADYVIPHARLCKETLREELTEWLRDGPTVLKPIDGMRGSGIHFAIPDGVEWVLTRGDARWKGSLTDTVARIEANIRGRMGYRDYLAQRFIDTRDASGRVTGIRVDIARLPEGGWSPYRFTARVAGAGKMVSNLMAGGAQQLIEPFLAERKVRAGDEIRDEAISLAKGVADTLNLAPGIEPNFEYGVDILIDRQDRLWFVEANGQPQGTWQEHPRAVLVIAYLLHLAGEPVSQGAKSHSQ